MINARLETMVPLPDGLRLVLLSFLMLFLELALIRWVGSNVVYLSFFSNFILLGSFLGIGIGFLLGRSERDLFRWAPVALAFLVGFVTVFHVELDRSGSDLIFFGPLEPTGLPIWMMLPVVFLATAGVMTMIGQGVARTFLTFPPLDAYRLDIVGSLLGIAGFTALSYTGAAPVFWGLTVGALLLLLVPGGWRVLKVTAVLSLVIILGRESTLAFNSWSPYYKVQLARDPVVADAFHISVNGVPHQSMASVAVRRVADPVYWVPYDRARGVVLDNVLVVGAGNGTDVAIALSEGAKHVDAVEIDPRIQELGAQLHPDRPYDDPRVSTHIDDGRSFLVGAADRYDLILFALPDSFALVSGQSSVRLESYLFTREAMIMARDHLKPGGLFAMYNLYREQWLLDRLAGTLDEVYGHPPCVDSVGDVGKLAVISTGISADAVGCDTPWLRTPGVVPPATDNAPFLYLREPGIPSLYLIAISLILLASVGLIWLAGGRPAAMGGYLDLFFMGAAFLLLETKSVVQFALLFGTTWFVNALVFAGVLLSVLAAIEVTRRIRLPSQAILYALLLGSVLISWFMQPNVLLPLAAPLRFASAVLVYFTPIFVANLVFAQRFRDVGSSNVAFGANLLGAMVGGLIEYLALITGYQALALVVALLYGLAFLFGQVQTLPTRAARQSLTARTQE